MPSIKIRGRPYTNLQEVFNAPQDTQQDTQISPVNRVHTQRSLPGLWTAAHDPQTQPSDTPAVVVRPRALTTSSRVYAHTLRNSQIRQSTAGRTEPPLDLLVPIPTASSPKDLYPTAEEQLQPVIAHGSQADLRLPVHTQPGLVERSLNEPTEDGHTDPTQHRLHHHDDVVEHLDVIGTSPVPLIITNVSTLLFFFIWT